MELDRLHCDVELSGCVTVALARRDEPGDGELGASGKSNRDTAAELYVTVKTVESHLRGVFAKLGVTSRREIAARLSG